MKAEAPRTVCVEVDEAFLRSTFFLSGERRGGSGRGVMIEDRDDLVGEDEWRDVRDCDDAIKTGLDGMRSVS